MESTDSNTKSSGLNVYGVLQMRDEVLDETAYKEGRIEWQNFLHMTLSELHVRHK